MKNLILASNSPRRKELLSHCEIPFEVKSENIDETINSSLTIDQAIAELAYRKAEAVFVKNEDAVVIGCDTIVVYNNEILGKPVDEEDAFRMLKLLSGTTHQVITGCAILSKEKTYKFATVSDVTFKQLSDETINKYIASKEPMDKAGAYGIQGKAGCFIESINGDYYSIMGLPLCKLHTCLMELYNLD